MIWGTRVRNCRLVRIAAAFLSGWTLLCLPAAVSALDELTTLRGVIVDESTRQPVPARLYIRSSDGDYFVVRSGDENGSAVPYEKQKSEASIEVHTALSAHPFVAHLPKGKYLLTVERGKEYLSTQQWVEVPSQGARVTIRLRRWIDMSALGWYSGETHVHRGLDELPVAMLADDLNVTLPLTYWVTQSDTPPSRGDRNSLPVPAKVIEVDATHVIYPINSEYEIVTVGGQRHVLGAVFALNHKNALETGAPPVAGIAKQVRQEGGLLELDKHNWPWSMMLVPVMNVDLYELANNHIWRTDFFYRRFGKGPAPYMNVERDERGWTERGWIDFTFQNYYALLNCGYHLRPTAGTASGVHPVPLGYGRVYVYLPNGFSYDAWIEGLDRGRSFVTTGPLLDVTVNGFRSDHVIRHLKDGPISLRIHGWAKSARPLTEIEIVAAGEVVRRVRPANSERESGGFDNPIDEQIQVSESTWIAVRCFELTSEGRFQFAHSAPAHVVFPGRPLRPRREEVQYLIDRVETEIARHTGVLSQEAVEEFRDALAIYKTLAETAR